MTRRGLGRGLASLIPKTSSGGVDEIDIDLIVPNPHQPRSPIKDESIRELAQSIREHGVLQPLVVSSSAEPGVYQLIAGERRLRASRRAGLRKVPVIVKEAASKELLEIALVENLQREDLNALEEAHAFKRLAEDFNMTQEAIAARVGRSRTAVANAMRLLALDDELKASLASGEMSEGHARALLGIEDAAARRQAWQQVVERGLTVRLTEELVRKWPPPGTERVPRELRRSSDPDVDALEERLRASLGTKVELRRNRRGRGRLVVHFYSDEELEAIMKRLGVAPEASSTPAASGADR
jgi:ParB family chromosome partitioning protein